MSALAQGIGMAFFGCLVPLAILGAIAFSAAMHRRG